MPPQVLPSELAAAYLQANVANAAIEKSSKRPYAKVLKPVRDLAGSVQVVGATATLVASAVAATGCGAVR